LFLPVRDVLLATLARAPPWRKSYFVVAQVHGNPQQATECVARQFESRKSTLPTWIGGQAFEAQVAGYRVLIRGLGGGTPPVGLVVQFDLKGEVTVAHAHIHHIFPIDAPQRQVVIDSIKAC
jgi:hypothetical protein